MKSFLNKLWISQLSNEFNITIPLYSGENFKPSNFMDENIYGGMYLIKRDLSNDLIQFFKDMFDGTVIDDLEYKIEKVELVDSSTSIDYKEDIKIVYKIMKGKELIETISSVLVSIPKVTDSYEFLIGGSKYVVIDELVSDFKLRFNKTRDFSSIRLFNSESEIQFKYYFEGTTILVMKSLNTGALSVYSNDEINELLKDTPIQIPSELVSRFNDYGLHIENNIDNYSGDSIIKLLKDYYEGHITIDIDDLRNKKVLSSYDYLFGELKKSIKLRIIIMKKYKNRKLGSIGYKTTRKLIYSSKSTYYTNDNNPLSYLSNVRKLTQSGDKGVKKASKDMREFQDSYKGLIDPVETPESGKIGLLLHRSLGSRITKDGQLIKSDFGYDSQNFNFASAMIPFVESCDSVRVMMGSNHAKQSISIQNSEVPKISTGIGRLIYDLFHKSVKSSKSGVVDLDNLGRVVIDGKVHEYPNFKISNDRTILDGGLSRIKPGKEVPDDYELYNSYYYKDGHFTLGANALIGYTIYESLNYEDALVISDEFAEKCTSKKGRRLELNLSNKIIKELAIPEVNQEVTKGDWIVKYRNKVKGIELIEFYDDSIKIFEYPKSGRIISVKLIGEKDKLVSDIDLARKIIIELEYTHRIEKGDKVSNLAGGKGVIGAIIPKSEMPVTPDGRSLDLLFNPLGVISRMNMNQLLEVMTGMLNKLLQEDIENNIYRKDIYNNPELSRMELVSRLNLINDVVKSDNLSEFISMVNGLTPEGVSKLIKILVTKGFVFEIKQFSHVKRRHLIKIIKSLGYDYDPVNGSRVFLPKKGKLTQKPIYYGYLHVLVLKHLVEEKISAIGVQGMSDIKERKQKIGEMEMMALESHRSVNFINEVTLVRSNKSVTSQVSKEVVRKGFIDPNNYKRLNHKLVEFSSVLRSMSIELKPTDSCE